MKFMERKQTNKQKCFSWKIKIRANTFRSHCHLSHIVFLCNISTKTVGTNMHEINVRKRIFRSTLSDINKQSLEKLSETGIAQFARLFDQRLSISSGLNHNARSYEIKSYSWQQLELVTRRTLIRLRKIHLSCRARREWRLIRASRTVRGGGGSEQRLYDVRSSTSCSISVFPIDVDRDLYWSGRCLDEHYDGY